MAPIMTSLYDYGGNTVFAIAYALVLPLQLYLGIRSKTWGFLFGMATGLILEVIGYATRVLMSQGKGRFTVYVVCLTIGPAFFSAAIYLCLARIVTVYGENLSRFRPRTITLIFIFADLGALILQAVGGSMAASDNPETMDSGLSVLQAGLAFHVVFIILYVAVSSEFAYSAWRNKGRRNNEFYTLQMSKRFKSFLAALALATVCILIRTSFRVAELSQGFDSEIARNETLFFALESAMVLLACIVLTIFHPGMAFQDRWVDADFQLKLRGSTHGVSIS